MSRRPHAGQCPPHPDVVKVVEVGEGILAAVEEECQLKVPLGPGLGPNSRAGEVRASNQGNTSVNNEDLGVHPDTSGEIPRLR